MSDIISADEILEIAYRLRDVCNEVMHQDPSSDLGDLLGRAASHLFEAAKVLQHPDIQRMDCLITPSGIHACGDANYELLCGGKIDMMWTIMNTKTIPTCPDCLQILGGQ